MAYSDAQKRAQAKYVKQNVKQKVVRFYPKDEQLYEAIKDIDCFGEYVKQLIAKDLKLKS